MQTVVENNPIPFEHLPLARAESSAVLDGAYRIYTDAKNYTTIQAASAIEALEMSGIHYAFKIKRENLYACNLLNPKSWDKAVPLPAENMMAASAPVENIAVEAVAEVAAESVSEPVAEAPAVEAAAAEAAEAPAALSNDDIDKLLNG